MAVARYTLAVDRKFKRDGEPTADFINCIAFGKSGEFAEKYLHKGIKMLIENKVQIEAIKTREYMAGKIDNTVMFTEGHFIVYIKEKDCLIDISKIKEFPKDGMEKYSADKIESLLKPIKLTNKALIFTGRTARLFENKETGGRIWLDDKYIKMFNGCDFHSAGTRKQDSPIVFTRYGKVIGLVLPMRVSEDFED